MAPGGDLRPGRQRRRLAGRDRRRDDRARPIRRSSGTGSSRGRARRRPITTGAVGPPARERRRAGQHRRDPPAERRRDTSPTRALSDGLWGQYLDVGRALQYKQTDARAYVGLLPYVAGTATAPDPRARVAVVDAAGRPDGGRHGGRDDVHRHPGRLADLQDRQRRRLHAPEEQGPRARDLLAVPGRRGGHRDDGAASVAGDVRDRRRRGADVGDRPVRRAERSARGLLVDRHRSGPRARSRRPGRSWTAGPACCRARSASCSCRRR